MRIVKMAKYRSRKWTDFFMHDADSRFNMTKPSTEMSDPGADLRRMMDLIYINGKPLKSLSNKYNGFEEGRDVLNFFNEVLLKDFTGDNDQRMDAMRNTCQILHQGGVLFPTTCAITDLLKADDTLKNHRERGSSEVFSLVNDSKAVKQKTNIITTSEGFTIQNNCGFGKITATRGTKLAKPEYGEPQLKDFPDQSDYNLTCDPGYEVLIQAAGVASVNLLKKEPLIKNEHLQISVGNKGLAAYVSPRSFKQAFMDFLKNIFNVNKYPTIKVGEQKPARKEERSFIESFIEGNKEMLVERNLHKNPMINQNLSGQSSKTEEEINVSDTPSYRS